MPHETIKNLAIRVADLLVAEHGFTPTRNKNRFIREDRLVRSLWLDPMRFSTPDDYRFDILFDLGIPGITTFSGRAQQWIVRAYGRQIQGVLGGNQPGLRLTGRPADAAVEDAAMAIVTWGCREFLLAHADPWSLYRLVARSARELLENPRADNEFTRLKLWPYNVVGPLELAAVYGTFLGDTAQARDLAALGIDYATRNGIDVIVRIKNGVEQAAKARAASSP